MTDDTVILIGREGTQARETLGTHAARLAHRGVVDAVEVVTYAEEPIRELGPQFEAIAAERSFVLPMCFAHSHETTDAIPAALSYLSSEVRYCEPIGRSPALTDLITRRASTHLEPSDETTLVLVGLGSSSQPYYRQTAEYHAARIREGAVYADVVTCYLLQNPAAECARYNVRTDRAVAVPLFLTRNETTAERIPTKLELDRGGIAYADPFGEHSRVTDAIHAEVERQRVFADDDGSTSFENALARERRPVATDGEGAYR